MVKSGRGRGKAGEQRRAEQIGGKAKAKVDTCGRRWVKKRKGKKEKG